MPDRPSFAVLGIHQRAGVHRDGGAGQLVLRLRRGHVHQAEALSNERPHYGAAPSVDAFVLPTAGYDVNLSPRTSELHQAVLAWTNGKV
jgi:hypothetical protein